MRMFPKLKWNLNSICVSQIKLTSQLCVPWAFWWRPCTHVLCELPLLKPRTANDKISCEADQLFTDPIWGVVMSLGRLLISLLMARRDLELAHNEPAQSWAGIDMLILSLMGYFHSLVNSTPDHNYGCLSDTQENKGGGSGLASLEDWKEWLYWALL